MLGMDTEMEGMELLPYASGVVGGIAGFAYGMKQERVLIEKALSRVEDPQAAADLKRKISLETASSEYPFVSQKLRTHLREIAGEKLTLVSKAKTPLGFCLGAGVTCFLGTTMLSNMLSRSDGVSL
jgi:hypothetical protein